MRLTTSAVAGAAVAVRRKVPTRFAEVDAVVGASVVVRLNVPTRLATSAVCGASVVVFERLCVPTLWKRRSRLSKSPR